VRVLVVGPGVDGELPESTVLDRLGQESSPLTLGPLDVDPFLRLLEWHPSEATALVAAAARGVRGQVEIRDAGVPVQLAPTSAQVFTSSLDQVRAANPLVQRLANTRSLDEAEQAARALHGFTELDIERHKASGPRSAPLATGDIDSAVKTWELSACERGTSYTTFRRLAEAIGAHDVAQVREHLVRQQPERVALPLWRVA
jgi:hypothetical protein